MKKRKVDLFKDLERKWKPRFLDHFNFNTCMNFTGYLVFALVSVILIKPIVNQFIPAKPSQPIISGGSVYLLSYSGLPLVFWFLLGIALVAGLGFHGFKLFSINVERK